MMKLRSHWTYVPFLFDVLSCEKTKWLFNGQPLLMVEFHNSNTNEIEKGLFLESSLV